MIPETAAAASLLNKIKAGKLSDRDGVLMESFAPVTWQRRGGQVWLRRKTMRKAAEVLADFDWLKLEAGQTGAKGGRPGDRYAINPAAWIGRAAV